MSVITNIFYFGWHKFVTFVTVTVITWAGHTRHMTGPHTKYFPTYFYNPDIFCLPFISFLLTGCSQDRGMHNASLIAWHTHDIRKQPRKLMNVFVWSWHGSHPGIIGPHWHRAPGDRWWWPGIVCQQVPPDFMIHNKPDVHKTRALITLVTRGQLIMHLSQSSQAWQHSRETITCHMGQRDFI